MPRDDMASLHRIFFLGNDSNWRLMEARLNAENRGQSFNAKNCTTWIKVLLRTQAFSESFVLRRKTVIDRIEREVNAQLRKVTVFTLKLGLLLRILQLPSTW